MAMHKFLKRVIGPVVEARAPRVIVEVGALTGVNTRWLANWAHSHDATLHCIDPRPRFDVERLAREHGSHFVMHVGLSLEVLPEIGPADVVLLDGDHNWYTAFHELQLIDQLNPQEWPLVLMHDVDWPFARRDMYHAPDNIPERYRQPMRKAGLVRYRSAPVDKGGEVSDFFNAEHEGGPRNGVLTAIEEFLATTERDLQLLVARGPSGLGLLVDPVAARRYPQLLETLDSVHDPKLAVSVSPMYATRELLPAPHSTQWTLPGRRNMVTHARFRLRRATRAIGAFRKTGS